MPAAAAGTAVLASLGRFALMGAPTLAIGLLPTCATADILAPALLVLLRVARGVGLGSEWGDAGGGDAAREAEHCGERDRRRGAGGLITLARRGGFRAFSPQS